MQILFFSKSILNIFCLNAHRFSVFRTQLLSVLNRNLGQNEFPSTRIMASPLFSGFYFLQVLQLFDSIRWKAAGGCPNVSTGINFWGAKLPPLWGIPFKGFLRLWETQESSQLGVKIESVSLFINWKRKKEHNFENWELENRAWSTPRDENMGLRKYFKNQIGVLRENSSGLEGGGESVLWI